MSTALHIANTYFEWELLSSQRFSLSSAPLRSPIFLQLQFLPLLYASPQDAVLLTHLPPESYLEELSGRFGELPERHLFQQLPSKNFQIHPWGSSPAISHLASTLTSPQTFPPWKVVQKINSKGFSFQNSPPLEGAQLLHDQKELQQWWLCHPEPKVFKAWYGVAGKGKVICSTHTSTPPLSLLSFCEKEWKMGRSILAEPWEERFHDFSTQWNLTAQGTKELQSITFLENSSKGVYRGSSVPSPQVREKKMGAHLEEHLQHAHSILDRLLEEGYFGPAGIDGMLYLKNSQCHLHPIVELNGRRTMSWVNGEIQKKLSPHRSLMTRYAPAKGKKGGLLPSHLMIEGKKLCFHWNLFIS